jgi:hypothetical protein
MIEQDTRVRDLEIARKVRALGVAGHTRLVRDYAEYTVASVTEQIGQPSGTIDAWGFEIYADHWLAGEFTDFEQGPLDKLAE